MCLVGIGVLHKETASEDIFPDTNLQNEMFSVGAGDSSRGRDGLVGAQPAPRVEYKLSPGTRSERIITRAPPSAPRLFTLPAFSDTSLIK